MPTQATAFPFAAAIAVLAAAAPACIDRALPGGGTLQGSTAGTSGVVASGAGGGGGAVTSGTGTGGGGGSAIGCPLPRLPPDLLPLEPRAGRTRL
jgi:hypothetical protein